MDRGTISPESFSLKHLFASSVTWLGVAKKHIKWMKAEPRGLSPSLSGLYAPIIRQSKRWCWLNSKPNVYLASLGLLQLPLSPSAGSKHLFPSQRGEKVTQERVNNSPRTVSKQVLKSPILFRTRVSQEFPTKTPPSPPCGCWQSRNNQTERKWINLRDMVFLPKFGCHCKKM